jgi:clan AA aspartic protease
MGTIRAEFEFSNPTNRSLRPVKTLALVDTGALHLCLPEHLAIQLDLKELEKREVTLANGHHVTVSYSGPVEIHFKNRRWFTGAMVMGDELWLVPIPMEDLVLFTPPSLSHIDVNPASPNIPMSLAK